jgi:RNA polymerase sigma-70 factor (ECF subfamily)
VPLPESGDVASDALVAREDDPETVAIGADQARKLGHAIAQLPDEFREVLVLREMEDMSYRDIASVIGAPIGTVMSRLARARAALKEKWLTDVEGGCRDLH